MSLNSLFTTYWSQLTLLLVGISYFIKRVFDVKSKKLEINHTVFQQGRINAVSNFLSSYSKMQLVWTNLPLHELLNDKINSEEILNNVVAPAVNELYNSTLEVSIFFDDHLTSLFFRLFNSHKEFNQQLIEMCYDLSKNTKALGYYSAYHNTMNEHQEANRFILYEISIRVKEVYGLKNKIIPIRDLKQ